MRSPITQLWSRIAEGEELPAAWFRVEAGMTHTICGDGRILAGLSVRSEPVARASSLELGRLATDIVEAALDHERPRLGGISTGLPRRFEIGLGDVSKLVCDVPVEDPLSSPEVVALFEHAQELVRWSLLRARGLASGARPVIFTLAEQRERTHRELALAAAGAPGTGELWLQHPAQPDGRAFTIVDATTLRDVICHRHASTFDVEASLSIPCTGLVTLARHIAERRMFETLRPRPAQALVIRYHGASSVPLEAFIPADPMSQDDAYRELLTLVQALRTEAGMEPRRAHLLLPAFGAKSDALPRARGFTTPHALPLHVVVVGDLGDVAAGGMRERTLHAVNHDNVARMKERLLVTRTPATDVLWRGVELLTRTARATRRDDVRISLLHAPLEDVWEDLEDTKDALASGMFFQLSARHLPTLEPVDLVLASWDIGPHETPIVSGLGPIFARGPTTLVARFPSGFSVEALREGYFVSGDPFLIGESLLRAFAEDPLLADADQLGVEQRASVSMARLGRHFVSLHHAEPASTLELIEAPLREWLGAHVGPGRALESASLNFESARAGAETVTYLLSRTRRGGNSATIRGELPLAKPLTAHPSSREVLRAAMQSAASLPYPKQTQRPRPLEHGSHALGRAGEPGQSHPSPAGSAFEVTARTINASGHALSLRVSNGVVTYAEPKQRELTEHVLGSPSGENLVVLAESLAEFVRAAHDDASTAIPRIEIELAARGVGLDRHFPSRNAREDPHLRVVLEALSACADSAAAGDSIKEQLAKTWRIALEPPVRARSDVRRRVESAMIAIARGERDGHCVMVSSQPNQRRKVTSFDLATGAAQSGYEGEAESRLETRLSPEEIGVVTRLLANCAAHFEPSGETIARAEDASISIAYHGPQTAVRATLRRTSTPRALFEDLERALTEQLQSAIRRGSPR